MPLYEYSCRQCDAQFERLVRNCGEEESVACPQCDCREVKRVPSCFSTGSGSGRDSSLNCAPSPPSGRFR